MCEWGDTVDVEVTIVAELSHTGKTRKAVKAIDRCIAPIVEALEKQGVVMRGSCCGHGKGISTIDLLDGRTIAITMPDTNENVTVTAKHPGPFTDGERKRGLRDER